MMVAIVAKAFGNAGTRFLTFDDRRVGAPISWIDDADHAHEFVSSEEARAWANKTGGEVLWNTDR